MTNQNSFSESQIDTVWKEGIVVTNYDPNCFRKDFCEAWMIRSEYGNTDNVFGWEIDHITPVADGGSNDLSNLQPLQWKNNRQKGDGAIKCNITAHTKEDGNEINVEWVVCPNCNAKGFLRNLHLSEARCHSCKSVIPL